MNFNLTILEMVTETAKAKAAGNASWLRAIEKAAEQLVTNPYISEHDGGLLILSYSNETYHANGACQCKAYARGMACWHRAAAKLVKRYREAEAVEQAADTGNRYRYDATPATDERAQLITDVKAAWHRAKPFEAIGYSLHRCFGVTKLEDVSTGDLRKVLAALTPSTAAPKPRRPPIPYHQALDACARGRGSLMKLYGLAARAGITLEQVDAELNARRAQH